MNNQNRKETSGGGDHENRFNQKDGLWHGLAWLLIVVLVCLGWVGLLSSCSSSAHLINEASKSETRDSVVSVIKDSTHIKVAASDSVQRGTQTSGQVSSSVLSRDSLEELIHERITESMDAQGNKTKTTDRTIQRKKGKEEQSSYDARLDSQQHEIEQMRQSIDSLVLSNKEDVGTHWNAKDSLYQENDKQKGDIATAKASTWWERTKQQGKAFLLGFALFVCFFLYKKYRENHPHSNNKS